MKKPNQKVQIDILGPFYMAVENISDVEEGKKVYSMFVKAYNEENMVVSMVILL